MGQTGKSVSNCKQDLAHTLPPAGSNVQPRPDRQPKMQPGTPPERARNTARSHDRYARMLLDDSTRHRLSLWHPCGDGDGDEIDSGANSVIHTPSAKSARRVLRDLDAEVRLTAGLEAPAGAGHQ
jgi:hypothetical protein